jgi:hypothetical protein
VQGLPLCRRAWCAPCYSAPDGIDFLVYQATDVDGTELLAPGEESEFLEAREGDHLFCPFECDECCFHRLRGKPSVQGVDEDRNLLAYIRRANLDAFWARQPGTVSGLRMLFREQVEVGQTFGFEMFPPLGPFGREYQSGMGAAIGILARSQRPGRDEAKIKFSSARKARTVHTNVYAVSARGAEGSMAWRSEKARFVATKSPTETTFFNLFMVGLRARMGERPKQDAAISIAVMLAKQALLEEEWRQVAGDDRLEEQRQVAENGAFFLFLFCGSLRGFEGPKVLLAKLREQIVAPGSRRAQRVAPHVALTMLGRFKARSQDQRSILIPIAYETASGLQPGVWAERLVQTIEALGVRTGWAFQNADGEQLQMSSFSEKFYVLLLEIQEASPELFPGELDVVEDFHLSRSHRRGATTRATETGVAGTDIDWINRWNSGTDQGSGPMAVVYSDCSQLMEVFLRFSRAL